jgi:transposase-like protein
MYMWRAVDSEGEVLEILVQPQRDKAAALRLLRKLLRRQGFVPTVIVTDKLRSYGAALREIGWIARARTARQQSSGEFSSAASTTRTKDARFQINQVGSAFCFRPCGRLQHIQCTTTFNQASDASTVPDRSA